MSSNRLHAISASCFLVASIASGLAFCLPWSVFSLSSSDEVDLGSLFSVSIGLFKKCLGVLCFPIGWVPTGETLDVFVPRITFIVGWLLMCLPTKVKAANLLKKPVSKKLAIISGVCEIIGGIFIGIGVAFFTVIHVLVSDAISMGGMNFQVGYFLGWAGSSLYITSGSFEIRAAKMTASNAVVAAE